MAGYDVHDNSHDILIKAILKNLDREGRLTEEADNIGIAGGARTLKEIMNTDGPLHIMDRGCLAIHFGLLV